MRSTTRPYTIVIVYIYMQLPMASCPEHQRYSHTLFIDHSICSLWIVLLPIAIKASQYMHGNMCTILAINLYAKLGNNIRYSSSRESLHGTRLYPPCTFNYITYKSPKSLRPNMVKTNRNIPISARRLMMSANSCTTVAIISFMAIQYLDEIKTT